MTLDPGGCAPVTLSGLTAGDYQVEIRGSGFFHRIVRLSVSERGARSRIQIGDGRTISGRVIMPSEAVGEVTSSIAMLADPAFGTHFILPPSGDFVFSGDLPNSAQLSAHAYDDNASYSAQSAVRSGEQNIALRMVMDNEIANDENDEHREGDDNSFCFIPLQFISSEEQILVATSDPSSLNVRVLAGDILVDAQGRPVLEMDEGGECGTTIVMHLLRPSTRERYTVRAERSVEEGGCGG
ncbi:MAG: hypothetical protein IPK60_07555 [Sandaracinaceae bacterium]|nr:hypothetical protein [Sandaracinaceae bacterium]